ncbi:MAG: ATP phosphoribosyltransferase [Propionibacteriaceae bacterium]|jgi:ATP phosphoribosyltransferase|nr:ATP phosphoribosyltransferase [Propionibacteriaceae bacterium]
MTDLMKIAVPNKGALAEEASAMLKAAGYRQRWDSKDLVLTDEANGIEFYYLRPRDIAVYVGEGTLDLGLTGRDMLLDSGAEADEILALGFGRTRFRFARPVGSGLGEDGLGGLRIATSYVGLLQSWLDQRQQSARLINLDGAVESAIRLGVADIIADVVETGSTLKKAGLVVFGEPILESEAILIRRRGSDPGAPLDQLVRRLSGVIVARDYVLVDFDVAQDDLDAAMALAPGLEGPTVSPLAKSGWCAVRTLVPRRGHQALMDQLWSAGARAILVTDVKTARL